MAAGTPDMEFTVERSGGGSGWLPVGVVTFDFDGMAAYVDKDVRRGERYGYRLVSSTGPTAEAWIDVPASLRPAMECIGSNPARGPIQLALTVPEAGPVAIRLVDVAGRQLDSREWKWLPEGRHQVTLDGVDSLNPGCYFLRMRTARVSISRSVVIVR